MRLTVGIVQMSSGEDKEENLRKAEEMIAACASGGARLIALPELFNYLPPRIDKEKYFANAEGLDGISLGRVSKVARELGVTIIGGSIIEKGAGEVYNTCAVVTPEGITGTYRKTHLFSYGRINEAEIFTAGRGGTVVELDGLRIGLTICFDLRFPELFREETIGGAEIISNVSAFLRETGKHHWMTLLRARAIENQLYIIAANQACGQARGGGAPKYFGHSCIVDPWGRVIAKLGYEEGVAIAEISTEKVREIRESLPSVDLIIDRAKRNEK